MKISLRVKDVMDDKIVMVDYNEPCKKAIDKMLENGVWSVLVSEEGLPTGVVTERDIIRRVIAKGLDINGVRVGSIMSSPLITIGPEEPLSKAMELMSTNEIRRVYVVKEGNIIGRVTQTGAFKSLLDALMLLSELKWYL